MFSSQHCGITPYHHASVLGFYEPSFSPRVYDCAPYSDFSMNYQDVHQPRTTYRPLPLYQTECNGLHQHSFRDCYYDPYRYDVDFPFRKHDSSGISYKNERWMSTKPWSDARRHTTKTRTHRNRDDFSSDHDELRHCVYDSTKPISGRTSHSRNRRRRHTTPPSPPSPHKLKSPMQSSSPHVLSPTPPMMSLFPSENDSYPSASQPCVTTATNASVLSNNDNQDPPTNPPMSPLNLHSSPQTSPTSPPRRQRIIPAVREARKRIYNRKHFCPFEELSTQEIDELFQPLHFEEAIRRMGTGDLLLFHGSNDRSDTFSRRIQGYSWWNHVACVVKDPPSRVLSLYGVLARDPAGVYVFEASLPKFGNCRMEGMHDFLIRNQQRLGALCFIAWRQLIETGLSTRADAFPGLLSMLEKARATPYEKNPLQFIEGWAKLSCEDNSSVFCSEAVMWALKEMGITSMTTVSSDFMPIDFSAIQSPRSLDDVLIRGNYTSERQLLISDI